MRTHLLAQLNRVVTSGAVEDAFLTVLRSLGETELKTLGTDRWHGLAFRSVLTVLLEDERPHLRVFAAEHLARSRWALENNPTLAARLAGDPLTAPALKADLLGSMEALAALDAVLTWAEPTHSLVTELAAHLHRGGVQVWHSPLVRAGSRLAAVEGLLLDVLVKQTSHRADKVLNSSGSECLDAAPGWVKDQLAAHDCEDGDMATIGLLQRDLFERDHEVTTPLVLNPNYFALVEVAREALSGGHSPANHLGSRVERLSARSFSQLLALVEEISANRPGTELDPSFTTVLERALGHLNTASDRRAFMAALENPALCPPVRTLESFAGDLAQTLARA